MNKVKILLIGILFLSLFITRCKKVPYDSANVEGVISSKIVSKFSINEAKSVFLTNCIFDSIFSNKAFLFGNKNTKKGINWDLAKINTEDAEFWIVEVPIEFGKEVSANFGKNNSGVLKVPAISKLLFLKDKKIGKVYITIMTAQPTEAEINQDDFHYKIMPKGFNGSVVYSNWDGTLNNAWQYENGEAKKIIKQKANKNNNKANKNNNSSNYENPCDEYIIDTWERTCTNYEGGGQECSGWVWVGSQAIMICYDGGGGGGQYITTSGTEAELVLMFDDKIDTNLLINCLDSVFSKVRRIDSGKFAKIVQDFSGDIPNFNWNVKSGFLSGSDNAVTNPVPVNGFFVTTFNMNTLAGASDLCIARTMIHECIHAYLSYYFHYDQSTYNKTYSELIRLYRTANSTQNINDEQHYIMDNAFINDVIAPALKQYGDAMGYNLNFDYYKDLAWGGINYNSNTTLSNADKIRIQGRLVSEQDGTGWGTKKCAGYVEQ